MCSKRPLEGSYAQTWRMNRGTPGKKDVHRRFEVEEMAFVELSRQVEESRVLKIFRKVICTGIWCFWGSRLYSDMEEESRDGLWEYHLRNLDFIWRVIKSHEIILIRNLSITALYLRNLQRQSGWGQNLKGTSVFKRN